MMKEVVVLRRSEMERLVRVYNVCASEVRYIHWIPDRSTGLWYGSAFVQMSSLKEAERLVQEASTKCLKIGNSRLDEWYLAHDGRVFTCSHYPPMTV